MMIKLLGVLALGLFLAGCETTSGLTAEGEVEYFRAQQAAAETALFELECPTSGCVVGSLKVNNPSQQGVEALAVSNPGAEIARSALSAATTLAPWFAVTKIATDGLNAAQGNTETTTTNTTDASQVDQSTQTTTTETTTLEGSMNTDTRTFTESNNQTSPPAPEPVPAE